MKKEAGRMGFSVSHRSETTACLERTPTMHQERPHTLRCRQTRDQKEWVTSDHGKPGWSGDDRRVAIMDFGASLTLGKAYLKIIMSSFLGFCELNTRNRWRDGQMCPDVDKELWRLGPDSSGDGGDRRKKKREREKEEKRARKREGLIVGGRGEENPRVLLGDADQESGTRMRKNALRTGRRQAVE
ncbi:hypothetical protein TNCV_1285821 [Trichonephila clavipes]|uniref:Uncharacterized protein n=1 Tax=Trichonephila clavipes TaxID=2585209 RepID=A0A8X6VEV8_TRICX|nr:hypothetical protein TNCV_1285821 [Trichonephila clavipes]